MNSCRFCGKDISYKKKDALLCDDINCIRKYDNSRKNRKNKKRICSICGIDISDTMGKRKICKNNECIKKYRIKFYKEDKRNKKCKYCHTNYVGTIKSVCCENCKKRIKENRNDLDKILQKIICKNCGKLMGEIYKSDNGKTKNFIKKTCDGCKRKNYEKSSIYMKSDLNPSIIKYGRGIKKKENKHVSDDDKKRIYSEFSNRMKLNNPMKNDEIKNKVKKTIMSKIENGLIKYKKGKDNPRFKGNRNIRKNIKIELRKWSRFCMERDNFTCGECNKRGGNLHVHHVEPFREILEKFKNELNIENLNDLKYDDLLYQQLTENIVKYHLEHEEIGITLCADCHDKIDAYYYKKKTNENKENLEV